MAAYNSTQPSVILKALGLTLDSKSPNQGFTTTSSSAAGSEGDVIESRCPSTGAVLAAVQTVRLRMHIALRLLFLTVQLSLHVGKAHPSCVDELVEEAHTAYLQWREVPAPKRGEILREIREGLASKKEELGALISLEMGKILQEGIGEVQEAIDICDCAWNVFCR